VLKPKSPPERSTIRLTLPKAGSGMFGSNALAWAATMAERRYPLDLHTTQAWHLVHDMTLPRGFKIVLVPDSLTQIFDKFEAKSATRAKGNRLTNEAWFRLKAPLVPAAEYQDLRSLLAATEELERQHVMLKTAEE